MNTIAEFIGQSVAGLLTKQSKTYRQFAVHDQPTLESLFQPADVLLVEGNQRISSTIKYLTQSTWSHAAMFVGDGLGHTDEHGNAKVLIEADLENGVTIVPLAKYENFNARICRPSKLYAEDQQRVVDFMVAHLGDKYDLKNIFDLLRYLVPLPIPGRFRRRLLALGSGDPTRAICSSLIAQAFQSVHFPILPNTQEFSEQCAYSNNEILHIRHHSLFAPRDFDLSPYFEVIKPTLTSGFDYKKFIWVDSASS